MLSREDVQRRVLAGIVIDEDTGCWEWQGCVQANGYGRIRIGDRTYYVHRLAYWAWSPRVGAIPAGLDVCHKCDNRRCARPKHLFKGTRLDNMRDAKDKGRVASGLKLALRRRGDKTNFAKLDWPRVRSIRAAHADGTGTADLAAEHRVSVDNIRRIVRHDTWREGFASGLF